VEFGLFDDLKPSSTFACCGCDTIDLDEPVDLPYSNLNDPSSISYALFEGFGLDNVKEDSFPPNIIETKPYAIDEGYLSECCRFITFWMSMPPMSGGLQEEDVDMDFDFGSYDGERPKMSVILDPTLWRILRLKKDLTLELLRWFLLLYQFNFKLREKGK